MPKKKLIGSQSMKANAYKVMQMAVEEGVAYGHMRAYKHTDTPSEDEVKNAIEDAVMNSICEWFDFDDCKEET